MVAKLEMVRASSPTINLKHHVSAFLCERWMFSNRRSNWVPKIGGPPNLKYHFYTFFVWMVSASELRQRWSLKYWVETRNLKQHVISIFCVTPKRSSAHHFDSSLSFFFRQNSFYGTPRRNWAIFVDTGGKPWAFWRRKKLVKNNLKFTSVAWGGYITVLDYPPSG